MATFQAPPWCPSAPPFLIFLMMIGCAFDIGHAPMSVRGRKWGANWGGRAAGAGRRRRNQGVTGLTADLSR